MRSFIEGIFLETCNDTRRVTYNRSSIDLFKLLLKESGWKTI